jgi:hypothetical protein
VGTPTLKQGDLAANKNEAQAAYSEKVSMALRNKERWDGIATALNWLPD